jgi:Dolichyl-phosphate-mannose-protein mannosyltransferase
MAIADPHSGIRRSTTAVQRAFATYHSLSALIGLLVVSCIYLVTVYNGLADTLSDPELAEAFVGNDSSHYLQMAEAFRSGQFLDKYVTIRPHRQPLYPALLAAGMALGADDLMDLATVNVIVGLITMLCLYGAGRWLFGSWWVGLAGALAYASSDFIVSNISTRMLTEPVFVLTALLTVVFAIQYMERNRTAHLSLAAAAAGLAYLARPNGLFLMAAMWTTLLVHDVLRRHLPFSAEAKATKAESSRALRPKDLIGRFGLAALVFVIVTAPSWLPRASHYGDPVYHGYLSNYLWVDTTSARTISGMFWHVSQRGLSTSSGPPRSR